MPTVPVNSSWRNSNEWKSSLRTESSLLFSSENATLYGAARVFLVALFSDGNRLECSHAAFSLLTMVGSGAGRNRFPSLAISRSSSLQRCLCSATSMTCWTPISSLWNDSRRLSPRGPPRSVPNLNRSLKTCPAEPDLAQLIDSSPSQPVWQ